MIKSITDTVLNNPTSSRVNSIEDQSTMIVQEELERMFESVENEKLEKSQLLLPLPSAQPAAKAS